MQFTALMDLLKETKRRALPIKSSMDLKPLIDHIGKARIVMLGESSHGTSDFYDWRRVISEWLVVKHGFNAIVVEGDWPSCRAVDQYAQFGLGNNAREVLEAFHRWPTWMWANTDVVRLAEWMKTHNSRRPPESRVGFYGLDVYSLFESMDLVIQHLEKVNLFYARQARRRYACFDAYHGDEIAYARSLVRMPQGCEDEVVSMLQDLLKYRLENGEETGPQLFEARQNARIVQNAEKYYRSMVHADDTSWNIRDRHMLETLDCLLEEKGPESRIIVWAHNTHIGDYRATDMKGAGLINLGGIAREKYGEEAVALVGFGTYSGTVTASHAWAGPIETLNIPPAHPDSYEAVFHQASAAMGMERFFMTFDRDDPRDIMTEMRGHRAIGVVYDPLHDRWHNYVPTALAHRYDAFFFIDRTHALQPLILSSDRGVMPETWPMGQ